ncbi:probable gluconokinase isoform X2 [Bombina bombina]|uniref:probable gluconokinase isoform X2 n=1 Tax=Bombina bombina TaxID=8345 RepID=UPI00235A9FEE|nr:probable gluconokinase isoform X2 [Bombina bombina]
MIFVIMGVSGAGKTEVGSLLARKMGWKFYDADDFHPLENKMKMSQGTPLNDEDRHPWLCKLHEILIGESAYAQNVVLACSALKKIYRTVLTTGRSNILQESSKQDKEVDLSSETIFIYLQGTMETISERLHKRKDHFMPLTLLESQFKTLEPPSAPERFIVMNVEKNISEIVTELQKHLESVSLYREEKCLPPL